MLDWQAYIGIAETYLIKARFEDRADLRQEIILRLAEVASKNDDKPLSLPAMLRVASYVVMEHWRDLQRQPSLSSLNEEIEDAEGNAIELYQTLADDKALDLDQWLDCKTWLRGCPKRLIRIAYKKVIGKPLNGKEQRYLSRYRQKELASYQKTLL